MVNLYSRVEKYRPQTLADLISHQDILSTSEYLLLLSLWRVWVHFVVMLSLLGDP